MITNTITFVTGRKGCGKSTLVAEIMREHRRVAVLDYIGEYGEKHGLLVYEGKTAAVRALTRWHTRPRFGLSLRVTDQADALEVLSVCREMTDYLLVVEETSWLCSPGQLPRELAEIVRMGRHNRISQVYVAQRPAMVHRDVTSQADVIVTFQQTGERDLKYLEDTILDTRAREARTLERFAILAATAPGEESKMPASVKRRLARAGRAKRDA